MEERFTAQMYVDYHTKQKGISVTDIGVAPIVVIAWGLKVLQSLAETVDAQRCPHWFYHDRNPLYTGEIHGQRVSFLLAPVGAPGTVMMMEELIACSAQVLLGLGLAGSLQPTAPIGTMLVPTACIREEGTSLHYLSPEIPVTPDKELVELLQASAQAEGVNLISGPVWTTDAPYRELRNKIEAYRKQGILGVDMETSAMYALGQFRSVKVGNLLIVSDELWHEWNLAFQSVELQRASTLAQRIILRCLSSNIPL
ncbi:MAG: nucleoside phosphorylase [Chloroflexota bacterium]